VRAVSDNDVHCWITSATVDVGLEGSIKTPVLDDHVDNRQHSPGGVNLLRQSVLHKPMLNGKQEAYSYRRGTA